MKVLESFLRAGEAEERKKLERTASKVIALEAKMEELSDDELKAKTEEFKNRLEEGETLEKLMVEAFAVVREVAYRTLGLKAYKVQLMGSAALHLGKIAEMKTGEGKTLVSLFPSYLNALTEKGVHIVTVNDYLASYQGQQMGRVFSALGMTTGIMQNGQSIEERRKQYAADITYGTNNEFGFDYLKDNMVQDIDEKVQRGHYFAIVDEVDSILIDEARTPLIISGPAEKIVDKWFPIFAKLVTKLEKDEHYEVDLKKRTVSVLPAGVSRVEDALGIENLYIKERTPLIGFFNNALKAKELFIKDKDYVVRDGEIHIVDEHTGRILKGRRYNDGLHQAIEAKERVEVLPENQTYATITIQNYFKMYEKLSGMTGTAETEAAEFMTTYKLAVIPIPTNKPVQRVDKVDKIYRLESAKFDAVIENIAERHKTGQPILVGTASVERSEYVSKLLTERGIKHSVLNAKQHEKEAGIVAMAGRKNAVTVATNMAGRGTDIILGGNIEFMTTKALEDKGLDPKNSPEEYEQEWDKTFAEIKEMVEKEAKEIRDLGGLYVIATERHESRRIDNQFRGRSGRQGDPGESVFYLSLQDDLVRRFNSGNALDNIISRVVDDSVPISGKLISGTIQTAQKSIESLNYETRKNVVKYDEVLTKQREIVYSDRDKILEGYDLTKTVMVYMKDTIKNIIDRATEKKKKISEDELDEIIRLMKKIYPMSITKEEIIENTKISKGELDKESLKVEILTDAELVYARREEEIGADNMDELVKKVMIQVVDKRWKEHLYEMDYLKEGIGLRALAQKDPLVEYNEEGYRMFKNLREIIKEDTVMYLFNAEVSIKTVEKMEKMVPDEVQSLLSSASKNPKLANDKKQDNKKQDKEKKMEEKNKNKDLLKEIQEQHGKSEEQEKDYSSLGVNRAERRKLKKNASKIRNAGK